MGNSSRRLWPVLALLLIATAATAQDVQWIKADGPHGGTVLSLSRLDGDILLAGTERGLYSSSDEGATWQYRSPLRGVTGVVAVGDVLVASTRTDGVHRSSDGGDTWTESGPGPDIVAAIAKSANSSVFVGTGGDPFVSGISEDAGLFRSMDAGASWEEVTGSTFGNLIWCITADRTGAVYANTDGALIRSLDDGSSWDTLATGGGFGCALHSDGEGTIHLARAGEIRRSDDDGATWEVVAEIGPPFALAEDEAGNLYAGTPSTVYMSDDAGLTWSQEPGTGALSLLNTSRGMLAGQLHDGISVRQDHDWIASHNGLTALPFSTIWALNSDTLFAGSAEVDEIDGIIRRSGRVFRSVDGGSSWQRADLTVSVVDFARDMSGRVHAATSADVYRSDDGGDHWTALPIQPEMKGYVSSLEPDAHGNLFVGLRSQAPVLVTGIYRSPDAGQTWHHEAAEEFSDVFDLALGDERLHAATRGIFSREEDGTWIQTLEPPAVVHQILRLPGGTLLAVRQDSIFAGTNDGTTWSGLAKPDFEWNRLTVNSAGEIIAAGPSGMFVSLTEASSWEQMGEPAALAEFLPDDRLLVLREDGLYVSASPVLVSSIQIPTVRRPDVHVGAVYPNPSRSLTTIEIYVPRSVNLRMEIFDGLGRPVRSVPDQRVAAGMHHLSIPNDGLSSGMYFLRIAVGKHVEVRPFAVAR